MRACFPTSLFTHGRRPKFPGSELAQRTLRQEVKSASYLVPRGRDVVVAVVPLAEARGSQVGE